MSDNRASVSANISVGSLSVILSIVFLVLKLTHVIDWAWIYVFLPVIISAGFSLIIFLIVIIVSAIIGHKRW